MFPEVTRDDVFRLETERLWLRWPRAADAASIARLAGDPQVALETLQLPHPYESRHAERFILAARAENTNGAGLCLAITQKREPDESIGVIGARGAANRGAATFGFWLGKPYWGHGLMSEAAKAFVDLVFGVTTLERIESAILPSNSASLRIHEELGFQRRGRGLCSAPARGGDIMAELFQLTRDAPPYSFGVRRPNQTPSRDSANEIPRSSEN